MVHQGSGIRGQGVRGSGGSAQALLAAGGSLLAVSGALAARLLPTRPWSRPSINELREIVAETASFFPQMALQKPTEGGAMRTVRYFRDLEAWQSAMDLAVAAHELASHLPPTHRFELASQMRRSATSIPSNVAEGHAQRGDRVFLRHVRIALGSLAELETQVEICIRARLLDEGAVRNVKIEMARTGKLLHGLRRMLRTSTALATLRGILFFGVAGGLAWFGLSA